MSYLEMFLVFVVGALVSAGAFFVFASYKIRRLKSVIKAGEITRELIMADMATLGARIANLRRIAVEREREIFDLRRQISHVTNSRNRYMETLAGLQSGSAPKRQFFTSAPVPPGHPDKDRPIDLTSIPHSPEDSQALRGYVHQHVESSPPPPEEYRGRGGTFGGAGATDSFDHSADSSPTSFTE